MNKIPINNAIEVYNQIINELKANMVASNNTIDIQSFIIQNFFNPTRRERFVFSEAIVLPSPFTFNDDSISQLEEAGWIIVIGNRILPTPLGIRSSQTEDGLVDTTVLIKDLQNQLAVKTIKTLSQESEYLTVEELGAVLFLLYNNQTSMERGDIGESGLDNIIDSIINSFIKGTESLNTRSLNGRPGGKYFVTANRKLEFKLYLKFPHYYIPWPHLDFVKEKVSLSVTQLKKEGESGFDAFASFKAFEATFKKYTQRFYESDILFITNESKNLVRKLLHLSE